MTYPEAQEGIAEQLWKKERRISPGWEYLKHKPFNKLPEGTRDVFLKEAAQYLASIFTPEEIEEWKKGGYPAIVCKDQNLPENPYSKDVHLDAGVYEGIKHGGYYEAQQNMAGFRRVKGVK